MMEIMYDINVLYDSYLKVRASSPWKQETQHFDMYCMFNLMRIRDSIVNGTYTPSPPRGFFIRERGKERYIESRCMDDKIVLAAVHDNIIMPSILPKLIYDNSASITNRGTSHFRDRLLYHLNQFYKTHGNNGYVLLMDYRKFFDNIWHDVYIGMLAEYINDPLAIEFIRKLVYAGAIDVSYMTDEEYANCMYTVFDNLSYRIAVRDGLIKCTGEKFMFKGLGLGSPVSQAAGLLMPHKIDNYITKVRGIRGYGRYMDDSYAIHESKEYLWDMLHNVTTQANSIGMFVNEKKTQIVSLKHEFSILQNRYKLHDDGGITVMPNNDTFKRETRKLKKQYKELVNNEYNITYDDISSAYRSWKCNIIHNANGIVTNPINLMDDRFNNLFSPYMNDDGGND